jgi:hypothetical protein
MHYFVDGFYSVTNLVLEIMELLRITWEILL